MGAQGGLAPCSKRFRQVSLQASCKKPKTVPKMIFFLGKSILQKEKVFLMVGGESMTRGVVE